ncbi:MAG: hypothetical protein ACRDHP_13260 [Ktedonobacterales bacterium]
MDDFERNNLEASSEDDEYEALSDPRRVMMEVVTLVDSLHTAATRLGDAIVAAGLPARAWRDADSRLLLLADQFPDITLDALITRLAEFAAGMGPHWLHGDRNDIARFTDEAAVLYGVVRPLRMVAQRLRMVPARERGDLPLERALGDARVGTQLDRVAALLRDLDSLSPFLVPLAPEAWNSPAAIAPAADNVGALPAAPAAPNAAVPPAFGLGGPTATQPLASGASLPIAAPPAAPFSTPPASPAASSAQAFRRLRDFMPPPGARPSAVRISSRDWSWLRADAAVQARALLEWVKPRKLMVVGIAIMLLALGTALLSLARLSSSPSSATTPTPASHLAVSPATLALACSGKGATGTLTLRDTATQPLTWSLKAPSGLSLSATHGALKPGASGTLTIKVTSAKAARGTLAFTSNEGAATVGYVVTCT